MDTTYLSSFFQVIEDIRLVFDNCWLYNPLEAEEYQCGLRLEKFFLKEGKKLHILSSDEKSNAPQPVTNQNNHRSNQDDDSEGEEPKEPPPKRGRRTF